MVSQYWIDETAAITKRIAKQSFNSITAQLSIGQGAGGSYFQGLVDTFKPITSVVSNVESAGLSIGQGAGGSYFQGLVDTFKPITSVVSNVESAGQNIREGGEAFKYLAFGAAIVGIYALYKNRKSVAGITGNILKGLM